ncbi:MAG: pentapeptide repeat-containing protein [Dolichospermum sp. BR01]|nr:pentapeptide repeat-containing protein [Dolichospermum sp. BR01]
MSFIHFTKHNKFRFYYVHLLNLNSANLRKADLTSANIYGATFKNADLTVR